jgi:hypothetical protein
MNRILEAVAKMRRQVEDRVVKGLTTAALVAKVRENLDMDLEAYFHLQGRKSALAGIALTLEETNTLYGYLGKTVEHFNRQPVEVKVVCTKLLAELLETSPTRWRHW